MKTFAIIFVIAAALVAGGFVIYNHTKPAEAGDKEAATDVPVHVGQIIRTNLRGYISAFGSVEPEPAGEHPAAAARVASPMAGVVTKVLCAEGQKVQKGEVLFQLDSRSADVAADFAAKTLERQKKLAEIEGTSQKNVQEAQQQLDAARVQQALLRIESPIAGTVVRLNVRPGDGVDLTTVLAEIIDLDRLMASLSVPANELSQLKTGDAVELQGGVIGTVNYISPLIDEKTGTAVVRTSVPESSGLHPGQFISARIISEERANCLAVPAESLIQDTNGSPAVAIVEKDKAVVTPVKPGLRDNGMVEVEGAGLQPGMKVVTKGAYGLPSETKITVLTD